jgi:hypothetical protein
VSDVPDSSAQLIITTSRRIHATAHQIFEILRDPKRHQEIDGSAMVRDSDALPVQAAGDSFVMRMNNEMFGDYEMRNEVVDYAPDRLIAWAPKRHDKVDDVDWNHRWGWRLVAQGEFTDVTAFFDCSRVPDDGLRILRNGEWGRPILERSLDRLEAIACP